jgi:hypothetical protein
MDAAPIAYSKERTMTSLHEDVAAVQCLAQAFLLLTDQAPRNHLTERMACRRLLAESELATFPAHAEADRSMLVSMLRDVAPRLEAEEQERRRASFDPIAFKRLFG